MLNFWSANHCIPHLSNNRWLLLSMITCPPSFKIFVVMGNAITRFLHRQQCYFGPLFSSAKLMLFNKNQLRTRKLTYTSISKAEHWKVVLLPVKFKCTCRRNRVRENHHFSISIGSGWANTGPRWWARTLVSKAFVMTRVTVS